ncbi:MAG: hypothetical protein ABSG96_24350 [Terracidiphilus sp.]|jgi:hypothetical protein
MTLDEIKAMVADAIIQVQAENPPLVFDDVHERSTAHRLAVHLDSLFPSWNVDCEYDRYGLVRKSLEGIRECSERRATDYILPDIIVHHRGFNGQENNLLVIEIKRDANYDPCDFQKLIGLTAQAGMFGYQFGLYINIDAGQFHCIWFHNGEPIK